MNNDFAKNLSLLIKYEHITHNSLAAVMGVHRTTVCKWISGDREPSIDFLWKLADYFDVSVDYLIGRKEIKSN